MPRGTLRGIHFDPGALDSVSNLGLVAALSWAFGPKVTQPWVKLQGCSVWRLLLTLAHWVPIPTRLVRMWLFHLLPLPLAVAAAKGSPQSLLSNLKADPCVLKDLLLKEFFSHLKFWNVSCSVFTCCYMCRLLPVSDVFLCFLCVAGSIVYLGMMVGAFFWGGLADKVGRKQSLLICMSINGFFAFLSSFVQGYGFFLFCRLLSGFG